MDSDHKAERMEATTQRDSTLYHCLGICRVAVSPAATAVQLQDNGICGPGIGKSQYFNTEVSPEFGGRYGSTRQLMLYIP